MSLVTRMGAGAKLWAARAGVAERAVHARHLRRVWALPGTLLARVSWPPSVGQRVFTPHWDYWWQAHLLDNLVDAQLRLPTPGRQGEIARVIRGLRLRNWLHWTNDYYDDIAWLGLALHRASAYAEVHRPEALTAIAAQLRAGWTDHGGGGIWWRRNDDFKNAPANGPAAILLARLSGAEGERTDLQQARSMMEWLDSSLVDPETGLVWDGLHVNKDGTVREYEKTIYTYCQGVFLGGCVELAGRDCGAVWAERAGRTINAVAQQLTVPSPEGPVLRGQGGGDGGLFGGILARYLALAVLELKDSENDTAADTAADLVFCSAEAAWRNRALVRGGPLFGPDWTVPAAAHGLDRAERDLSVQLGGWMLLEAAALLERSGVPYTPRR